MRSAPAADWNVTRATAVRVAGVPPSAPSQRILHGRRVTILHAPDSFSV
jgi:hypothetical protein